MMRERKELMDESKKERKGERKRMFESYFFKFRNLGEADSEWEKESEIDREKERE